MGAALQLLGRRGGHDGMVMSKEEGAVSPDVIHVLIPVHVPLPRSFGAINVDRERLEEAGLVRDPAGEDVLGPLVPGGRAGKLPLAPLVHCHSPCCYYHRRCSLRVLAGLACRWGVHRRVVLPARPIVRAASVCARKYAT